jgi:nucleoside-diphosphate-sugar epimerase
VTRRVLLDQGQPIPGDSGGHLNLVHIDDAAQSTVGALDADEPDSLYLVSDDRPVKRSEYYAFAAGLLDAPSPRLELFAASSSGTVREAANRRIANRRMRT